MNANNPKSPAPAPRRGPFCPNCLRGEGKHFPACPLEGAPRRVSLDLSKEPDKSAIVITDGRGRVLERHEIPGRVPVEGCGLCKGHGKLGDDRCPRCGGTGGR